jgi:hypothetical protein
MVINKITFKEAVKIKDSKVYTSAFSFVDVTSRPVLNTPKHDINTSSPTSYSSLFPFQHGYPGFSFRISHSMGDFIIYQNIRASIRSIFKSAKIYSWQ